MEPCGPLEARGQRSSLPAPPAGKRGRSTTNPKPAHPISTPSGPKERYYGQRYQGLLRDLAGMCYPSKILVKAVFHMEVAALPLHRQGWS